MSDRRRIFGWAVYDWANSAYITTVTVAVLPIIFADAVVGPDGFAILGRTFSATTLWAWMIGLSALIIFVTAPVLGAIADYSSSRKRFLMTFCCVGSLATMLLWLPGAGDVWPTMILFVIAQTGFVGGNVFYDSFLPRIAAPDRLDRVSGFGFALGYAGGGLHFALSLGLITLHDIFGLTELAAARLAVASAGVWWGGFAIVSFILLGREAGAAQSTASSLSPLKRAAQTIGIGFSRNIMTARKVGNFRHLVLFLVAFMIYDDGIQTVITMATIYGRHELGFSSTDLMLTLLIIQFVALGGALVFGRLGELISTKRALIITIVLWSGVVIYAWFMTRPVEYYILGVIVGIAMGGSQALSRSLYGSMIPPDASAEFYGFYSVFSKFSAIGGPFVFGLIDTLTGSSRQALLSIIVFFIVGLALLAFVDVDKARAAREKGLFDTSM